ncbi:uncharacterized protein LACBIDRAFT_304575 [Laccaria bicolor S238N-H82]|uniref:Predicted protein n=1 Tax=Laccaria bicolor (strain S238N-H82 / ATCC MYA-4686) TaxID=486041 RepID=B0DLX8_LACBS|nr:uncharacterized protein LACBIDRAFT_304575 [Laccaria bicolor S238N-H82]EDR04370.1 predicted protein [Laccaria bicolor S238N-H82]|eukprot:XP_001884889.1 predicted protein [Laccaria bicolor S238N-H82]
MPIPTKPKPVSIPVSSACSGMSYDSPGQTPCPPYGYRLAPYYPQYAYGGQAMPQPPPTISEFGLGSAPSTYDDYPRRFKRRYHCTFTKSNTPPPGTVFTLHPL